MPITSVPSGKYLDASGLLRRRTEEMNSNQHDDKDVDWWPATAGSKCHHIKEDHLPDNLSDLREHPHRRRNRGVAGLADNGGQHETSNGREYDVTA